MGGSSVELQKCFAVSKHLMHCLCFWKCYQVPICLRGLVPNCRWRSGRGRDCIKSSSDILDQCARLCTRQRWRTANFWTAYHDEYRARCFAKLFLLTASPMVFCWCFIELSKGFLDLSEELLPISDDKLLSPVNATWGIVCWPALLFITVFYGSSCWLPLPSLYLCLW